MAILKRAEQVIVDAVNRENSLNLTVKDLQFFTPTEPTVASDVTKADGRNTMCRVAATQLANATGATYVYFNRLDFSAVFTGPDGNQPLDVPVDLNNVNTAHGIIPALNQFYGMELQEKDIVNHPIDHTTNTVFIEAMPESLGWIGSVVAKVRQGDPQILTNFTNVAITGYSYPYFNTKLGQGAVYSYPFRFDDYAAEFQAAGLKIDISRLAAIIKAVTGNEWVVFRNPIDYNLKEAKVSYNGKNQPDFPTNPSKDNVMIVELSLYCTNFGGRLYLHYNDAD